MAVLTSITTGKPKLCQFCGQPAHPEELCCPRISAVHFDEDTGRVSGVTFWGDYFDEEENPPPDAA